jgi:alanine racemase
MQQQYAFTMELKKHLDEVTEDRVVMLSKILINKLKRLINDMNKSKLYDKYELDTYISDLEQIEETARSIINGESKSNALSFDECINRLKWKAEEKIKDKKGNILKLLLIK